MVGVKGGRALRQREGDDSHSRFFFLANEYEPMGWAMRQCKGISV